ncbi:MBL fold metallo-hydrolase [Paenibacillus sp. J22TS3]|uniref:MBL fold metallo-hydrolase n=1 Tax=Paenibacillus sp. J22TS3 TaxID=2807192 RepID=UPI001B17BB53|nr:MBL fold metallo-hydrolase [Paenibacillus sp. J22TS3]GIP24510.1 Zn-dependent hydrolase [Paenibacillus sp. J22TS3]
MINQLTNRFVYMSADGTVDRPILGAILGEEQTLYIDAGNSKRHAKTFREAVGKNYSTRSSLTALTHWHWDHSFGAAYDPLSPLIATGLTYQALQLLLGLDWSDKALDERVRQGQEIAFCADYIKKEYEGVERDIQVKLPDITFTDSITLYLGGVSCHIQHVGGVHAQDSCVMYIPEEKVLFLGDVLGPAIYDGPRYYAARDFLRIVEKIKKYPAAWYIESHYRPVTAEEFWQDINESCVLAELVIKFKDNKQVIEREWAKCIGRELGDEDKAVVHQFMLGEHR